MCEASELACRGACFSEVGEVHNGCELIARTGGTSGMESIVATAQGIFAIDGERSTSLSAPPGRLLRFAPPDYQVAEVKVENSFHGKLVAADDSIYLNAGYVMDDVSDIALHRIAQAGGDLELIVDPDVGRGDPSDFEVIDGYVWYYVGGLHRVPVTGGEPELILERAVDSIAMDATHYYFHVGPLDYSIERSLRSNPTQSEVLVDGEPDATLVLDDADPDGLYYYDGSYQRIPRDGGESEVLVNGLFTSLGATLGTDHVLVSDLYEGCFAIPKQGGTRIKLDNNQASAQQISEDADAFYIAREDALFRIAKDQL